MNPNHLKAPCSSLKRPVLLRWLIIVVGASLGVISGVGLLEAEHRGKLLGLWPVLLFVPIPLATWLNYRTHPKTPPGATGGDPVQSPIVERGPTERQTVAGVDQKDPVGV